MHYLLRCPDGWRPDDRAVAATQSRPPDPQEATSPSVPFTLHMQQNRSAFPESGRGMLVALLSLCMAATIIPAVKGYYLVPIAVLLAMAALVLALEYFQRQPVAVGNDRDRVRATSLSRPPGQQDRVAELLDADRTDPARPV